jgi:hypothetical protein
MQVLNAAEATVAKYTTEAIDEPTAKADIRDEASVEEPKAKQLAA